MHSERSLELELVNISLGKYLSFISTPELGVLSAFYTKFCKHDFIILYFQTNKQYFGSHNTTTLKISILKCVIKQKYSIVV